MAKIKIYKRQFLKDVRRMMEPRVRAATKAIHEQTRENISIPTATHGTSRPGEYPHLDTGELRRTLFWEVKRDKNGIYGIVATPLHYGAIHEFGERPFLKRTVVEMGPKIRRIILEKRSGRFRTLRVL